MKTAWVVKAGTIRTRAADCRFNWCGFACPGLVWPPLRSRSCRAPSGSRYRPTRFQLPHQTQPVSGKGHHGLPAARGRPAPARAALGALVTASGMLPRPRAPSGFFRPHPSPLLRAAALPHSRELGGGGALGSSRRAGLSACMGRPPAAVCGGSAAEDGNGRRGTGGGLAGAAGACSWRGPLTKRVLSTVLALAGAAGACSWRGPSRDRHSTAPRSLLPARTAPPPASPPRARLGARPAAGRGAGCPPPPDANQIDEGVPAPAPAPPRRDQQGLNRLGRPPARLPP